MSLPPNSTHPKSRAEWRKWLEKNHARPDGVWLISYKKATGKPRIDYGEAVEEALCFGWIDSKPGKLDEERSMLWFAPRKKRRDYSERMRRVTCEFEPCGSNSQGFFTPFGRSHRTGVLR